MADITIIDTPNLIKIEGEIEKVEEDVVIEKPDFSTPEGIN